MVTGSRGEPYGEGSSDDAPAWSIAGAETVTRRRRWVAAIRLGTLCVVLGVVVGSLTLGGAGCATSTQSAPGFRIGQIVGRWQPYGTSGKTTESATLKINPDATFATTTDFSVGLVPLIGSNSPSPAVSGPQEGAAVVDFNCRGIVTVGRSTIEFHTTSGICGDFTGTLSGELLMIHDHDNQANTLSRIP
jgi:hypothetical protein